MSVTLNGAQCLCPKKNGAMRVLDLGTGSGIWAIEYGKCRTTCNHFEAELNMRQADAHPEADVIGVDLSPVQPSL
jgi:methylase of polypeptide subunit release factors